MPTKNAGTKTRKIVSDISAQSRLIVCNRIQSCPLFGRGQGRLCLQRSGRLRAVRCGQKIQILKYYLIYYYTNLLQPRFSFGSSSCEVRGSSPCYCDEAGKLTKTSVSLNYLFYFINKVFIYKKKRSVLNCLF